MEALPPRPAPGDAAAATARTGAWFLVDNGGALAFRSSPSMDLKTTAIARPRELVYAAEQPPEHYGWIRTRENLWLPKQFLLPLTDHVVTPEEEAEAHELHRGVAEKATADLGDAARPFQPNWYRVDDGGGVAFRKSPAMEDRTSVAARAGELLYISEQSAEHPDWMKTEEGLWIPARFLAPLSADTELPTQAELERAKMTHRETAHAHYMETAKGWEDASAQGQLTGIDDEGSPSKRNSLGGGMSSPMKGKVSGLKSGIQAKGGKLKHTVSNKLERHDAEPEPGDLLDSAAAISVLAGCRAEITAIDHQGEGKPKVGGKQYYTVFVIHCKGSAGNEWTIKRRFRQFRGFRERLMRHGAPQLKDIAFPRKKVRNGKEDTDRARSPILQSWLNLVISVFSAQPDVAPFIAHFLDAEQRQPGTGVMKVGEIGEPVDASRICGEWHAMGMNRYRRDAIEHEQFVLEVDEAASAAAAAAAAGGGGGAGPAGGTVVVGRNADPSAPEPFRIEQVILQQRPSSGLYLSFQQVYDDDTKTNWTCQLDERCRSMTNGVWTALSGQFTGSVVGNFGATVKGAMGSYKVISADGCLVRSGAEKTSPMLHTLAPEEVIEVTNMVRLDSGVQRYFFSRPDLPLESGLPLEGWVSASKEDGTALLELLSTEDEVGGEADGEGGQGDAEAEPVLQHMMHSVGHSIASAEHALVHAAQHIHQSEESARKFLTDQDYRENTMNGMRQALTDDAHKISQEIDESGDMVAVLVAYAEGQPLSEAEKQRAVDQLLDICKVVPALGIFLLPGGAVFLPLLAKILPFSLMPSAFAATAPAAPTGKTIQLTVCQSPATATAVGAAGVQVCSRCHTRTHTRAVSDGCICLDSFRSAMLAMSSS